MKRARLSHGTSSIRAKSRKRSKNEFGDTKLIENENSVNSGLVYNKGHGQHILKNPLVLQAIVDKAGIKPTDVVLEIGPGTGNLTEKLLGVAKKVIAFEIDSRMVAELRKRFQSATIGRKLEVIEGDCLRQNFPYFDKCVANTPYAISSALVFKLLRGSTSGAFRAAVLMFQKEFAQRLVAKPGDEQYSRLSVNTQLLAKCSHLMKISKNSFDPPPQVESSVVRLEPRRPAPKVDFDEWDGLMKLLFNRKNRKVCSLLSSKNIRSNLYRIHRSHSTMKESAPIDEDVFNRRISVLLSGPSLCNLRARRMTQDDFAMLLAKFHEQHVYFS